MRELRQLTFFRGCSVTEVEQVRRVADVVDIAEGGVIHHEAVGLRWVFVVVSGTACVTENGAVREMLSEGDSFGEVAVLTGSRPHVGLMAVTPVKILLLGAAEFLGLLEHNPRLGLGVARRLAASDEQETAPARSRPVPVLRPRLS